MPPPALPAAVPAAVPGVVLCRGCCCGTRSAGSAGVRERLERWAGGGDDVRLSVTECLGPCDQADVVVVRPSAAGRRAGGRPVWLGLVDEVAAELVEGWVGAGGPGVVPLPPLLELHLVSRPLRRAG